MNRNDELVRRFHAAQQSGDAALLVEMLADDVVWHVPGRNLLSRDYRGKAEVMAFWGRVRALSASTIRHEIVDVLGGTDFAVALVRVFAARERKSLDGSFQAWTYRIQDGQIAEFWFLVEDRYAVDAFWS
jgi:hypothetical protein